MRRAERPPPGERGARPAGRRRSPPAPPRSPRARPSGGRIEGSRRAAIDLPAPGGPVISRLCPPAAATSSARRSPGWPRRSARSGRPCRAVRAAAAAPRGEPARPSPPSVAELLEPRRSGPPPRPATSAASAPLPGGDDDRRAARRGRALGHRQRPGDRADRAVEGELAGERHVVERRRRRAGRSRRAARRRSRGRSPGPALRRSAGARLAVIRCCGNSNPELTSAARTRSRDSRTAASGSPTSANDGRPWRTSTSTRTSRASTPSSGEGAGDGEHGRERRRRPRARGARTCAQSRVTLASDRAHHGRARRGLASAAMTAARQQLGRARRGRWSRDGSSGRAGAIVARNVRPDEVRGEIDLIALDGAALVFVEVKARRAGLGARARDARRWRWARASARKLRALAAAWLRERGYDVPRHRELRFDVVGVRLDAAGRVVESSTCGARSTCGSLFGELELASRRSRRTSGGGAATGRAR